MNVKLSTRELDTLRQKLRERPKQVFAEVEHAVDRTGFRIVALMKRDSFRGLPASLTVRSGRLRQGFRSRIKTTGTKVTLTVENDTRYARIQEYGGVITPKNAKYLAIPLAAAKTSAGVSRFASPRLVPDLVFIQRRGKNPLLVKMTAGKRPDGTREFIPYYVLVPSVTIRPRLGMRRIFDHGIAASGSPLQIELKAALKRVING